MGEFRLKPAADVSSPSVQSPLLSAPRNSSREAWAIGGICLVLAVVLRVIRVSYRELFGDELWTVSLLQHPQLGGSLLDRVFHGHLPFYYDFMALWTSVIGGLNPLSVGVLRAPSVVFGLLTFVAFIFFAQRYLKGLAFAVCVIAFAMNPILVASSNHVAPFALLGLFTVLSNYFCIRGLDEGGKRNWSLWAVFSVLGALTHPFFWFLLAGQFVFGLMRPRRTPRPFYVLSIVGVLAAISTTLWAALYAGSHYPRSVDVATPVIDDMARALVSVLLGDLPRYGYNNKAFLQAVLYLFVLVTLVLSVFYYRRRAEEAAAMPENVVFIDMTQDVVGFWTRLSLASFLLFQWITFIVPALGIWMVGSYASDMTLEPEYFLICLPSLVILIAAGIDATRPSSSTSIGASWRRWVAVGLGLVFTIIMAIYTTMALTDHGFGLQKAAGRMVDKEFDRTRDALVIANVRGMENAVSLHLAEQGFVPDVMLRGKEQPTEINDLMTSAIRGKNRIFVFYHNDYRRVGRGERSFMREWVRDQSNAGIISTDYDKWAMSRPEGTELQLYRRVVPALAPRPVGEATTATMALEVTPTSD